MSLTISRVLHAGYIFESGQVKIIFDPIFENPFSGNCYAFPSVEFDRTQIKSLRFDAVFISHYHDDHCSFESLDLIDRATPVYVYCVHDELFAWIRELGFKNVFPLQTNIPVQVGGFEVLPLQALDPDIDSIFQIKAAGFKILNVVDAWIDPSAFAHLRANAPWDLVLWPFQTLREIDVLSPTRARPASKELPGEWIEQLQFLRPRYVVPSSCQFVHESWSWYNHSLFPVTYQQFQKEVRAALPDTQILRLNPSVTVVLDHDGIRASNSLPWIRPIGEQDVDYEFHEDVKPQSTSEISQNLAPLTVEQRQRVIDYCRSGLVMKYQTLAPSHDPYFETPRVWRLSLYEALGEAEHFYYRFCGGQIELAPEKTQSPSWSTEIPAAKLYSALEEGEALTSLYLRVNDYQGEDVMEDPLIRGLFDGVFGAYQMAQLNRLKLRPRDRASR